MENEPDSLSELKHQMLLCIQYTNDNQFQHQFQFCLVVWNSGNRIESINKVTLHLWASIQPQYVTSHPGLLSLLTLVGREIRTGQTALILCDWG